MANCSNFSNEGTWIFIGDPFPWYDYILCLLIVVGIVGNSLVIFVQSRLGTAQMGGASATNRLIIGLAAADLLTAIFLIPIPELVNVPQTAAGEFYCRVIESRALVWISFMGSVYTMTTISIERFLAIVHPFTYKIWAHNHHVNCAFVVIWISATTINVYIIAFHAVGDSAPYCGRCISTYPSVRSRRVNGVFLFLIEYLGPLCIMVYASLRSTLAFIRSQSRVNAGKGIRSNEKQTLQLQKLRRRFTMMFVAIFTSFMILWTPDQLSFLLYNLGVVHDEFTGSAVYKVFLQIAFLNAATANPIIYSACLPKFRLAILDVVTCRGLPQSRDSSGEPESSSTMKSSSGS